MFELLLLAAVVLITISQLLPEDEPDEHQTRKDYPLKISPERQPNLHNRIYKKNSPARTSSGRAVISIF